MDSLGCLQCGDILFYLCIYNNHISREITTEPQMVLSGVQNIQGLRLSSSIITYAWVCPVVFLLFCPFLVFSL